MEPEGTEENKDAGIRILSLDAGGPGAYSQLLIIKEYMARLANDTGVDESDVYPADYFEMIGGVGFGGLIAVLLGRLRMNVDEAIEGLISVAGIVFPAETPEAIDREANTKNLKQAVEDLLQTKGIQPTTKMYNKNESTIKCKVVVATASSADLSHPILFRTYATRSTSLNPTIVEGICATMAIPSLFVPAKIGPRLREKSFVGGAVGANNPTRELLKEAANVFGKDKRVTQILSIGAGNPRIMALGLSSVGEGFNRLVHDLASDCEMVAKELSSRLLIIDAYLRLNVDKGVGDMGLADWARLGDVETHTTAYVESSAVTDAIDKSLQRLRERVGSVTLGQLNHSSTIKVMAKTPPAVSPCYVMRTREWEQMIHGLVESNTTGQKVLPITGMGGCGKTQMVSYFLQEKGHMFTKVVFVDATSECSIKTDLQTWARSLEGGHDQDVWEDALRILANEPFSQPWLLILDNADDPDLQLLPFIPKCSCGSIIITSRNRDAGYLSNTCHLEMGQMDRTEALTTLLKAAKRQLPLVPEELISANTLLDELGCLAVALVQAGTYCHQLSSTVDGVFQPYSITNYLSLFHSRRSSLMKKVNPLTLDGYGRGVYTTLDLSYNAIPPSSRDLLHLISYFHHSDIPLSVLATASNMRFRDPFICLERLEGHKDIVSRLVSLLCADQEWDELRTHEIIQTLRSFSLVSTTNVDDSIFLHLHPLVKAWAKDKILPTDQNYCAMAAQTLSACCFRDNVRLYRYLVPHIDEMLCASTTYTPHVNEKMALAQVLLELGHYHKAELLFSGVLRWLEGASKDVKKNLWVTEWLARAIQKQGRWNEAEKLEKATLEQRRAILGEHHPDTIRVAANLACIYLEQGRREEAEKLEVGVLQQQRMMLGKQHPDTIRAAANLACTYLAQGRWSEAETLGVEVLEQRETTLGMQHPDTMLAAANLARIYGYRGKWNEAEKLEVEVMKLRRAILGKQHPDSMIAAANLACTYCAQGRWGEAEKLEVEVLEQRRTILGEKHPGSMQAAANLARTYYAQGRWDEAEKLELEVLEQRKTIIGKLHPDTIHSVVNLASTLHKQGRWSEAERLEVEALGQREAAHGKHHPNTIFIAANLACTYRKQGRWSEAEKLGVEVLEKQRATLGKDHPETIRAVANLACTFREQGRWDEAEKLEVEVLDQRRAIIGTEHPDTIRAAVNLAITYSIQGKTECAVSLLAPAVEASIKVMGHQHPETQEAIQRLSGLLG